MARIDLRISPSDTRYAAADVRGFIRDALNTAPAVEVVQELLVTHVEGKLLHPSVVQDHPGECPICSMTLVLKPEEKTVPRPAASGAGKPAMAAPTVGVPGLAEVDLTPGSPRPRPGVPTAKG